MMVIDMELELQRLICMSMDKMTVPSTNRHKEDRNTESKKRKCGGLNLRKALLVAHVLQDMRNAYVNDDYTTLLNTVRPDLKHCEENSLYSNDDTTFKEDKNAVSDDYLAGRIERPTRDLTPESKWMEVDTPFMKPQDCAVSNDTTISRSCQFTYPVPVSVNTKYVLSPRTSDDEMDVSNEEIPEVCQQVEVVSDTELTIEPEQTIEIENNKSLNTDISMDCVTFGIKPTVSEKPIESKQRCPLPRKKRPLPKELIEEFNSDKSSPPKRIRSDNKPAITSQCCAHNTTTSTTQSTGATFSSLASSTNSCTYVTTSVTSQISTTSSNAVTSTTGISLSPRVVVELNNQMSNPIYNPMWGDWQLPATCRTKITDRATTACANLISDRNISNLRNRSVHLPMLAC